MTPCHLVSSYRCFGAACCLHLQCDRCSDILIELIAYPDDYGINLRPNIGKFTSWHGFVLGDLNFSLPLFFHL